MKLAFVIFKYYPYGGLQRDCLRLAKFCMDQGHDVHLFTMQWQGEKPEAIRVHQLPVKGLSNHKRAVRFGRQVQMYAKDFDLVIGFDRMPGLDFYFAGDLCFAQVAKEKHGAWFQLTPRYKNFIRLEHAVFKPESKTKIFVLTDLVKRSYQTHYATPENRFTLIPPGIRKQQIMESDYLNHKKKSQRQLGWDSESFHCLQIGSDFKRKGVDRSIKALVTLPEALKQKIVLYVIGQGKEASYKKLAKALNVFKQVYFLGPQDALQDYMQAADLLIHPAYFETAGMVLIEALSFGLPVLVTENCGYAHHIEKAKAGIFIKVPFCQVEMDHALRVMLQCDKLETFSKNALAYASTTDLYSMDQKCLEEMTKLFMAINSATNPD